MGSRGGSPLSVATGSPDAAVRGGSGGDWLGIELRHLAALRAIWRTGSFRAAANELGYVPSAVSAQINALERIVGERLIDRSRGARSIHLTEAGETLLAVSEAVIACVDAGRADIAAAAEGVPRELRLAVSRGTPRPTVTRIVQLYVEHNPAAALNVADDLAEIDCYAGVKSGRFDLALAELAGVVDPLAAMEVERAEWALLVPRASKLAEAGVVDPDSLDRVPFVATRNSVARAAAERRIAELGATIDVRGRADSIATVTQLVAAGIGVAVVPNIPPFDDDRVLALPFDDVDGLDSFVAGFIWHRERARRPLLELLAAATRR